MPSIAFTEPDMTYHDSSDDSIRRLTDDFGRHRLTVGSTASSMDGLWELHPRRLSEAGLSRHSDSSAVLTEDTDSFIIGQRVWVGGTKPGTIAYIGETQFAPGEWAGIALDEAIGKNDGSVGGIRYFQCENKKGVFSRLTRLTRVPIEQPGMGSNETFTSPNNGVRSSRSPISPTGSTRSLLKSAMSLSTSNTSLTSSATHTDFKNGDRVIIKSTQGSKVGTVRYMGLTDFAPGEWVGVELDDPRGKNDGSVEGKRYFECRPNFGLFAPLSKVSKSPSKYKPTACVVHSGPGLPPSGIKRANSKESITSLVSKTSAASSVRRDVLREKQQHIEQLLKERDLERAEITRAASQADDAEHRFFTLKEDFEKYRAECESKVQENSELLSKLKIDRKELLSQLEDEKRRNEDLQFRFEEAAISNSDIEVVNENYVKKIGKLERSLAEERQKTETLEGTSNKLFEAEEGLIKAREEIDTLKKDLATTRKKKETLEEEQSASSKLLESLQNQIQGASVENEEKTNTISRLNDEISKVTSEHELIKREVEETKKKAGESCQEKDAQIEKLKSEVEHQRKIIVKYEKTHADLVKENEKLKMELSGKSLDAETATDKISTKENEIKSIRTELETVKKALEHKSEESERHKANSVEVEQDLQKELVQTRDDLKEKISEVEKVKKECFVEISQKDQQLQEANKTIAQNSEEIKKLSSELNDTKASFETSKNDIHSRHARQVASQDSQLMALSAELQQKNEEITKSSIVISKLEEDLCTKNGVIEKLRLELESFESQKSSHTETSTTLTMKITELTLHNGDLERKLSGANDRVAELLQLKDRLEAEIRALTARCVNSDQIEQFRNEIQVKENLLGTLRAEFEEKLHASERLRHELELQFETTVAGFEQLRRDLESKLQISTQSEALLRQRCDSSITELGGVRDEFRRKIDELQHLLQEREFALSNLQGKASESDRYYQEQLRTVTEELNQNLQSCQQRISILTDETSQLKEQLSRKSEQIIEVQAESSHIVAQCQQIEKELKQKSSEDIKRLEFELNEKTLQIQKTEEVLKLVRTDCHSTNVDLEAKDRRIGELTAEVQQGQKLLVQLQDQFSSIQLLHEQKTKESEGVQSQCQGLLEQVAYLTEQVRTGEDLFKNVQIEHNNAMQLVNRLRITEQQKQQCLQQLQLEVTSHSGNKNCNNVIELLNQVKVDNSPENTEKILSLLRDIDIIKNQLAERNHQYDVQNGELLRLQQELLKAQELNGRCVQQDQNLLIQDRELAENQIRFLNSIIVDIQKKNEEQRARIEILEAGCSPDLADELKLIGSEQRQIPPRMYCDICEEFDLHETEDCPKQISDGPANGQRGPRNMTERPYCEICEAFGHATEDCQEDQTF